VWRIWQFRQFFPELHIAGQFPLIPTPRTSYMLYPSRAWYRLEINCVGCWCGSWHWFCSNLHTSLADWYCQNGCDAHTVNLKTNLILPLCNVPSIPTHSKVYSGGQIITTPVGYPIVLLSWEYPVRAGLNTGNINDEYPVDQHNSCKWGLSGINKRLIHLLNFCTGRVKHSFQLRLNISNNMCDQSKNELFVQEGKTRG